MEEGIMDAMKYYESAMDHREKSIDMNEKKSAN